MAAAAAATQNAGRAGAAGVTTSPPAARPTGAASSSRSVRTVNLTTTLCSACGVPTATVVANAPVIYTGAASSNDKGMAYMATLMGLVLGALGATGMVL
jgi:hypothetical protein